MIAILNLYDIDELVVVRDDKEERGYPEGTIHIADGQKTKDGAHIDGYILTITPDGHMQVPGYNQTEVTFVQRAD